MRRVLTVSVAIVIMASCVAWSFDGERKGFVLGGGLGVASAGLEVKGQSPNENQSAGAAHVLIGYGFNELNMLVAEGNVAVYEPELTPFRVTQGWGGISWYHYFTPEDKSFYTVLGLGTMNFDVSVQVPGGSFEASANPGGGLLFGAGYSFSRHFQVGLNIAAGETSVGGLFPADFKHVNVSLLVSGIAF